jgi:hypothetical protein
MDTAALSTDDLRDDDWQSSADTVFEDSYLHDVQDATSAVIVVDTDDEDEDWIVVDTDDDPPTDVFPVVVLPTVEEERTAELARRGKQSLALAGSHGWRLVVAVFDLGKVLAALLVVAARRFGALAWRYGTWAKDLAVYYGSRGWAATVTGAAWTWAAAKHYGSRGWAATVTGSRRGALAAARIAGATGSALARGGSRGWSATVTGSRAAASTIHRRAGAVGSAAARGGSRSLAVTVAGSRNAARVSQQIAESSGSALASGGSRTQAALVTAGETTKAAWNGARELASAPDSGSRSVAAVRNAAGSVRTLMSDIVRGVPFTRVSRPDRPPAVTLAVYLLLALAYAAVLIPVGAAVLAILSLALEYWTLTLALLPTLIMAVSFVEEMREQGAQD